MSSLPFDEQDYRSVIRKWVIERPNRGRGELKAMAEKLGVPSPVFSQILSGLRELSEDQGFFLSEYMGFTEQQTEYFLCLVQLSKATRPDYREHLKKRLTQIQTQARPKDQKGLQSSDFSEADEAQFFSSWTYLAIPLFCGLKKGARIDEICEEFQLKRQSVSKILEFLTRVGLVELKNNVFMIGNRQFPSRRESHWLTKHHENWRQKATERSCLGKAEDLIFTGPVAISEKDFSNLKRKMVTLLQEFSETVKESKAEKLACLNLDFFEVNSC